MSRKSRCRIILQRTEWTTDFNPLENLSEFMTETCQDVGLWVALTTWNFSKAMEAESQLDIVKKKKGECRVEDNNWGTENWFC